MHTLHRTLLAGTMVLLTAVGAQAQSRIAVVNMKVVFDGYWKTRQSTIDIRQRQATYDSERKKTEAYYLQLHTEIQELLTSSNAPTISAEERRKRQGLAESKLAETKELERTIMADAQTANAQVQDQMTRMRDAIIVDIRQAIDAKAKAAGYNLVANVGGEVQWDAVVLYTAGLPDLTQEILTELNSKAPPGVLDKK